MNRQPYTTSTSTFPVLTTTTVQLYRQVARMVPAKLGSGCCTDDEDDEDAEDAVDEE